LSDLPPGLPPGPPPAGDRWYDVGQIAFEAASSAIAQEAKQHLIAR
jgi:NAD+ kinase